MESFYERFAVGFGKARVYSLYYELHKFFMRTQTIVWIVIILIAVFAAGAWYHFSIKNTTNTATTDTAGQADTAQMPLEDGQEDSVIGGGMALSIKRDEKLGSFLIGFNNMTLYTFKNDKGTESTCYYQCMQNWPPYVVAPGDDLTHITAGVGGKVSYSLRTDGNRQLTYNGHPLYFYAQDVNVGDTNGQAVGNVWYAVKP